MKYLVSKEIKSETKVGKNIYIFDLFFVIVYESVSLVIANLVHPSLRVAFYIFSLIMALFLTGKSYYNKKRRNYESLFIYFWKDRTIYYPVLNVSKQPETKEEA